MCGYEARRAKKGFSFGVGSRSILVEVEDVERLGGNLVEASKRLRVVENGRRKSWKLSRS